MGNFFEDIGDWFQDLIDWIRGKEEPEELPAWHVCTKASLWNKHAEQRMMNTLSPHMPDSVFYQRLQWQKERGCNTTYLILANQVDGEYGGYCIYGNKWEWSINRSYTDKMLRRVREYRDMGFAVVLCLITDQSEQFAQKLLSNPNRYLNDLRDLGFLDHASFLMLGLEMNEYYKEKNVGVLAQAARTYFDRPLATHQTSGRWDYHIHGDLILFQLEPVPTKQQLRKAIATIRQKTNKPVFMFELCRDPHRPLMDEAIRLGYAGGGNF